MELQLETQEIKIKELETKTTTITQSANTENIDQTELLEFLSSYVSAQKTYIKKLQEICRNNEITYPQFIYAELEEQ